MSDIKKHVEFILDNYTEMIKELNVLEFELENMSTSLDSNAIENRVLSRSNSEWVSGTFQSDKTADIVIEHVDSQRNAKYHALINLIRNMRLETRRLEHYLTLLPEEEADVIRWFYFEELSWAAITKKTLATQRTMQRRRQRGFDKLVKYYSVVDRLSGQTDDIRMKVRFISYVHEEQYIQCLGRVKGYRTPGTEAVLYIISGCNELWNAGPDTFFDFETGEVIPQEAMTAAFSSKGAKLLRLAYCYAGGLKLDQEHLLHMLRSYFSGLENIHLELAIEAMRLALFSDI